VKASTKQKKRVLIVDDEAAVVTMICDFLKEAGFETVGVNTTAEAQAELEVNMVDVVLLDIQLPREDGLTFLRKIKEVYPDLPVVMLTGAGMMQTAFRYGASGYFKKNTDFGEILNLVKRLAK